MAIQMIEKRAAHPLPAILRDLRASLVAAGWTAESPDHLTPEGELIATAERWT